MLGLFPPSPLRAASYLVGAQMYLYISVCPSPITLSLLLYLFLSLTLASFSIPLLPFCVLFGTQIPALAYVCASFKEHLVPCLTYICPNISQGFAAESNPNRYLFSFSNV